MSLSGEVGWGDPEAIEQDSKLDASGQLRTDDGAQVSIFDTAIPFGAVCVFHRSSGRSSEALRDAAAQIFSTSTAKPLVAVAPGLLGLHTDRPMLPRQGPGGRLPSTQGDLLVQLIAPDMQSLFLALRDVDAAVRGTAEKDEELWGGKLGDGREPFGFRDGLVIPTADDIRNTAVIPRGPLKGGSFLLYLRFHQASESFARLTSPAQERVMGRTHDGDALKSQPKDSHVARMSRWPMVRRGFPFRAQGNEGLAFLALNQNPDSLAAALDRFVGLEGPSDALMRYCTAVGGGLYIVPPRTWFHP